MQYKWIIATAALTLFTACGGGGGDDGPALTFSPSSLSTTVYAGAARKFDVRVTASGISGTVYAVISEPSGVITDYLAVGAEGTDTISATLELSPLLPAGRYRGNIDVKLCRDNNALCLQPVSGSPWRLPYDFTVQDGGNLSALRPLTGAVAWKTVQGNAAHNGFVPAAVNPANFSRRFLVRGTRQITVEDGRIFSITQQNNVAALRAVGESDGQTLWTSELGSSRSANDPGVSDGKVYLTTTGTDNTALWAFNAVNGTQLAKITAGLQSQFHFYPAPTVHNGKIFVGLGYTPSIHSFDAETYALDWTVGIGNQPQWTPSVDNQAAYAYQDSILYAVRRSDGEGSFVRAYDGLESGSLGASLPVLDGLGGAYVVQYRSSASNFRAADLMKFNTSGPSVTWRVSSSFHGTPVFANGVLYVLNAAGLEARSPATGALLWRWTPPATITWRSESELVIVGNHAFVGTSQDTFAIDLTTRQQVWTYPDVGTMSVSSNGILYILNDRGSLSGINLH